MAELTRRQIEEMLAVAGSRLNFRDRDLSNLDLSGLDLDGSDLQGASLSGADLTNTDLTRANLSTSDLRDATMFDTRLSYARFDGANLSGHDLSWLKSGVARYVSFQATVLVGANLEGVDMNGTSFRQTDFREANLTSANLNGVELSDVDFRGTNLTDATLHGASFTSIRHDATTRWPLGFDITLANFPSTETLNDEDGSGSQVTTVCRRWAYLDVVVGQTGWSDSSGRGGRHPANRRVDVHPFAWICNQLDAEGWELVTVTAQHIDGTHSEYSSQRVDSWILLFRREYQAS